MAHPLENQRSAPDRARAYVDVQDRIGAAQRLGPQPGPQTVFHSTPADIAIYGGAAGGGKSWSLLAEPLRHVNVPGFAGMIFRRTSVQVTNPGGLWDESMKLFPLSGGRPRANRLEWMFDIDRGDQPPGMATIKFGHLEHEKTTLDHGGGAYPYLGFDELTLFTRKQFFFMLSRNRSTCGVAPYIRATCNPDADSWVAEFIAWWIDQKTGYPIQERSGVIRWMIRVGDEIKWGDTADELIEKYGADSMPLSVTFIKADVYDNRILLETNPRYLANLNALSIVERERLLKGNWKIKPAAGLFFQRSWCTFISKSDVPKDVQWVRGWDLASTKKIQGNDPDWTSGVKLGKDTEGRYYIGHNRRDRVGSADVEKMLKETAKDDGKNVPISIPQDPGQAGKFQVSYIARLLDGYVIRSSPEQGDKITRFSPFSAQAEAGNVFIVDGDWNDAYLSALEAFPDSAHDDDVDATSRAFQMFHVGDDGLIEYYRRLAAQQQAARDGEPPPIPGSVRPKLGPGVVMIAPQGVGTVYGMDGTRYTVGTDRKVAVKPADVAPLSRSGFVLAPIEEGT